MKIDKQNGGVCFNEESHTYFDVNDEDKKYVSVTTLIHSFTQDFDANFWSAYKALEKLLPKEIWVIEKKQLNSTHKFDSEILNTYNISENDFNREQQAILDEWEANKNEACERGTKIHADLENSFYKSGKNIKLDKFGIGGKFECKKDYTDLDMPYGVYPEYLIYRESEDGILRIAGQIDCIVKNGNEITLIDWKTNREIKKKSGYDSKNRTTSKMKYPLNALDDCNFYHYTMQLSTYAWMLQKLNPNFIIKDLILYHFDHNNKETLYHCEYLKDTVEKMLRFYKKQLILDKRKQENKPIDY